MRKNILRIVALTLSLACLLAFAACDSGEEEAAPPVDGNALFRAFLDTVSFETELKDVGEGAALYFTDLPASAQVRFYTGDAYYADCLALITIASTDDRNAAVKSLYAYVDQMTVHFRNYHPEQVSKCNKAVIWQDGVYAILCITGDNETAQNVVRKADEYAAKYANIPTEPTAETQPEAETTQTQQTEPEQTPREYPVLTSQSAEISDYGDSYLRVDNMAYMPYKYREESVQNYAAILNDAVPQFNSDIKVYSILIPTAIGIVLPDDIRANMTDCEDQNARMEQLFGMLDEGIIRVNAYENLMQHRDEYLYFRTDFHWTGTGAYYAYEAFCQAKGITPYTLDQRKCSLFDSFKGKLYVDDQVTPDEVYAYHPFYENTISMIYTNRDGEEVVWDVIKDVSSWPENTKYNTFAGGDQPFTVYENPNVDGGVAVVIKESFGNALIPYLVDHYSVVYEIDYRYWEGNIAQFANEKGANDVIFANNIGMTSTAALVDMLSDNF